MTWPEEETAASANSVSHASRESSTAHSRRHSSSTHIPVLFFKKRIVPSSPTSFVKPARRAAAVNTGARNSAPTSDHVPELMYAHGSSPDAGTAATAAAVSCEHDATTRGPRLAPRAAAGSTSGSTGPRIVAGFTIGGQRAGSSPA